MRPTYTSNWKKGAHYVGLEITGTVAEVVEVEPAELLEMTRGKERSLATMAIA